MQHLFHAFNFFGRPNLFPSSLALLIYGNGKPYRKKVLERIWQSANREAAKKYGVPEIEPYAGLKHRFGTQRLAEGFSLDGIKEIMGHTDVRMTQRYAKYLTKDLVPAMRGNKP